MFPSSPFFFLQRPQQPLPQAQAQPQLPHTIVHQNPQPQPQQPYYRAHHPWPPNFALLTPKHRFSLERRYRRRAKLKWARPSLQKTVVLTQGALVGFTIIYGVFFAEWSTEEHVFTPIRKWVKDQAGSISVWTTGPGPPKPNTNMEKNS